jgi:undecaprenyl-diphosphatase
LVKGEERWKREMVMVLDLSLMQWVNLRCTNWVFDLTLPWITYCGSKTMGFLFALILFVATKSGRSTLLYMVSFGINAVIFGALKYGIKRGRPFAIHDVILRISPEEASRLDPSFPSAHSAIAFMIATTLSHRYGRYRFLWYSIAGVVGLSRVYLGVHYPVDVIVGAAIGYGVTKAVILVSEGGDQGKKGEHCEIGSVV